MARVLHVFVLLSCVLGLSYADGLGLEDVEALKQVEAHIEEALQPSLDSLVRPDAQEGVEYVGPLEPPVLVTAAGTITPPVTAAGIITPPPAPAEDATPRPRTTSRPLLGEELP